MKWDLKEEFRAFFRGQDNCHKSRRENVHVGDFVVTI